MIWYHSIPIILARTTLQRFSQVSSASLKRIPMTFKDTTNVWVDRGIPWLTRILLEEYLS